MEFPFKNFDEDLEKNAEQKLSFQEKAIRTIVIGIAKVLIWKVNRARTYGDLYKIAKWFTNRVEGIEKKWEDKYSDGEFEGRENEAANIVIAEGEELLRDLEDSKDQEQHEDNNIAFI